MEPVFFVKYSYCPDMFANVSLMCTILEACRGFCEGWGGIDRKILAVFRNEIL